MTRRTRSVAPWPGSAWMLGVAAWPGSAGMLSLCFVLLHITAVNPSCIFDSIKPASILKKTVQYTPWRPDLLWEQTTPYERMETPSSSRRKRSLDDLFKPIRIRAEYHQLVEELSALEQQLLQRVVSHSVHLAQQIFSVIPVEGALLLGRSSAACNAVWQGGVNAGKCAKLKSSYIGETCLDNFKIPASHLEGLYLWNVSHPEPVVEVYPKGQGLLDTDYVLYVTSRSTTSCLISGPNIIAYAAYCQTDQNNRPIAGYINFCPQIIRDPSFDEDKVRTTSLHELFHALGFSSDLFDKFQDCSLSGTDLVCSDKPSSAVKVTQGATRLATPKVIELTSEHFGCQSHQSMNEFGPVLQILNNEVQSHWDAAFMQGSLMTPDIGLPHLKVLDAMTLAFFEDSGWYKVNYQYAQTFIWGKGQGCNFGLESACRQGSSAYFCTGSSSGCHHLHFDKGTCATDPFLHGCQIYKATAKDSCRMAPASSPNEANEFYSDNSRCFRTNITAMNVPTGSALRGCCLERKCNGTDSVFVRVGSSGWLECPDGASVPVPGFYGVIECPPPAILCDLDLSSRPTTTLPPTTLRHPVDPGIAEVTCLDIKYQHASYKRLLAHSQVALFRDCVVDTIQAVTSVSRRRVNNILLLSGSLIFRFDLLPVQYSDDGPASKEVIVLLERAVWSGNFTFLLPPSGPIYRANSINVSQCDTGLMDGGPIVSPDNVSVGVIVGITLGSLAVAVVIALSLYFVQRYYATHTRVIPDERNQRSRNWQSGSSNSPRQRQADHGVTQPRVDLADSHQRAPSPPTRQTISSQNGACGASRQCVGASVGVDDRTSRLRRAESSSAEHTNAGLSQQRLPRNISRRTSSNPEKRRSGPNRTAVPQRDMRQRGEPELDPDLDPPDFATHPAVQRCPHQRAKSHYSQPVPHPPHNSYASRDSQSSYYPYNSYASSDEPQNGRPNSLCSRGSATSTELPTLTMMGTANFKVTSNGCRPPGRSSPVSSCELNLGSAVDGGQEGSSPSSSCAVPSQVRSALSTQDVIMIDNTID